MVFDHNNRNLTMGIIWLLQVLGSTLSVPTLSVYGLTYSFIMSISFFNVLEVKTFQNSFQWTISQFKWWLPETRVCLLFMGTYLFRPIVFNLFFLKIINLYEIVKCVSLIEILEYKTVFMQSFITNHKYIPNSITVTY